MSPTVLIANQSLREAKTLAATLAPLYEARPVTEAQALFGMAQNAAAVVLDANFSDAQGIDVLMDVLGRTALPVVMVTPEDQPECALEAMRCGAAGFVVKTAAYAALLSTAVRDAIERSSAKDQLKREMIEVRKRNALLEKEVRGVRAKVNGGDTGAMAKAQSAEVRMGEIVVERIKNGSLQLPAYPGISIKLRKLLQRDVGIAEVGQLMSQDAAVSAKLLRVANSARYGNLRQVQSVEGAVSRLGLVNACNVAELVANRSLYSSRNALYRHLLDDLWIHSIAVAHACISIARQVSKPAPQNVFLLGLLHDSGRLALTQAIAQADSEGRCIEGEANHKLFLAFLRKHNVGCGVALMRRWGFDSEFADAVRYSVNITGAARPTRSLLIVNLANTLARAIGYGVPLESPEDLEKLPAKGFLLPGDSDLTPIIDDVHSAVEQTRKMVA